MAHTKISGGIFIGLSQIPINNKILDLLCRKKGEGGEDGEFINLNFEFKKDYVVRCLNSNKHNHITTSYYLMLKKYQNKGEIKPEDF